VMTGGRGRGDAGGPVALERGGGGRGKGGGGVIKLGRTWLDVAMQTDVRLERSQGEGFGDSIAGTARWRPNQALEISGQGNAMYTARKSVPGSGFDYTRAGNREKGMFPGPTPTLASGRKPFGRIPPIWLCFQQNLPSEFITPLNQNNPQRKLGVIIG